MKIIPTWRKNALFRIRKTLRTLTTNRGFLRSSSAQTEESVRLNIPENHNGWKATEIALLEAERKKAEATMYRSVLIK